MNIIKTGSKALTIGNNFMQFGRALQFSTAQSPISQSQGTFNSPFDIAIDPPSAAFPDGRIFVVNRGNSTVSILNYSNVTSGSPTVISYAQGSFSTPEGIAIDPPSASFPNGRIFVVNNNETVSILNYSNPTAGSPTVITKAQGSFGFPYGIAIDPPSTSFPDGRIFVTNYLSSVSILNYNNPTAGGATVITSTLGALSTPYGIAIDAANNKIFVSNSGNSTVSILNYSNPTAGSPPVITQSQGSFNSPRCLAIDAANNRIFVANYSGTVSIINYTNPTAGSPSVITQAQGSFNAPQGIAIDAANNRIFVANAGSGNNTVSIITNIFL